MSLITTRVQVTTSAAQLLPTSGPRRSTVLFNNGPLPIAIGQDNSLTMANGFLIPSGASLTIDHDPRDEIWVRCSVLQVTPADTSVMTESSA